MDACRESRRRSAAMPASSWRRPCRRSDTVAAQMAGFGIERRLLPPDSKEAQGAWPSADTCWNGAWRRRHSSTCRCCPGPRMRVRARAWRKCARSRAKRMSASRYCESTKWPLEPRGGSPMIDLYYWPTPNGHKITMFLEETAMPYTHRAGEHRQGRAIQAGVSRDLAEQSHAGHRRSRAAGARRTDFGVRIRRHPLVSGGQERTIHRQAICAAGSRSCSGCSGRWAVSARWPGRIIISRRYAPEKIPYAIERYVKETNRLYGVLNKRLADREFVAGAYSIADMACLPLDRAARGAGPEPRGFSAPETLVRGHQAAPGHECAPTSAVQRSAPTPP